MVREVLSGLRPDHALIVAVHRIMRTGLRITVALMSSPAQDARSRLGQELNRQGETSSGGRGGCLALEPKHEKYRNPREHGYVGQVEYTGV